MALALVLPVLGFSQYGFSVGVNANAQLSAMRIKNPYSAEGIEEKGGLGIGYALGIQVQYGLSEKTFLRTGLNYQTRNYRHKIEGLLFGTDILNGTQSSLQNDITISSISIPIDFGYLLQSRKEGINYLIGFGGLVHAHVDTKTKAKILHEQIEDEHLTGAENTLGPFSYSLGIFGGIEMPVSKKISLSVEPNLRFTPDKFTLYLYNSEGRTAFETGLTLRIRIK